MSRARELLVSGRTFTTDEAATIGLVHQLVRADELLTHVLAYAADIAVNVSPASVFEIKDQLRLSYDQDFLATVADAEQRERRALGSVDFHEGVMSFVERRPPAFAPFGEGGKPK
jgi:enoyl-CoA hydratase/carnithine racemase